ncbi:inverse autotransporter beta domain-containing protein [Enterobacter sp. Bisph1]|uniref:inverse autotransporter beta domain-containing protein n=1 Tax=Enterobacter sp. Bisph1 TaxID=1274399 RepID=UPI000691DCE2|nr:inverse autotransporter beta domain-containing protein [Enterobacter sp. Bisph1]
MANIHHCFLATAISCVLSQIAFAADTVNTSKDGTELAQAAQRIGYDKTNALGGLAAGYVVSELEPWLSQFGTVQINAGMNSLTELNNSSLDMLLPLFSGQHSVAFTQFGLRKYDDRVMGNLGLGQRHFFSDWMVGYNAFYDHDITGSNRRWGAGVELWHDYSKLSANGYFRLSDWKASSVLRDYDERPANGGDIRYEGYLPSLPQLGGKLAYEKYFGDEVALFGKNSRQKDPYAITAGLNYTPFPLLTLGVDYRTGKAGEQDTQVFARVNYRLGVPFDKQTSSDLVPGLRTLSASRLDLVERNNNIVMSYRKQEELQLQLPDKLEGQTAAEIAFQAVTVSRNPIERIIWNDAAFVAAGGKINKLDNEGHFTLTLPATAGNWVISGQAVDNRGRVSNTENMQVISYSDSTPTPDKAVISDVHMLVPGNAILGDGYGALIYGAKIDAAHAGESISWKLKFNITTSFGDVIPFEYSDDVRSDLNGDIKVIIPVSQLVNYSMYTAGDFEFSLQPENGDGVMTNEGNINLQIIQVYNSTIVLDKNYFSLPQNGSDVVKANLSNRNGPMNHKDVYIDSNCYDCTFEHGPSDENGDVEIKVISGKTPGNYKSLVMLDKFSPSNKVEFTFTVN